MAAEESVTALVQQPATADLSTEPIHIHIPRNMKDFNTNLKYLANLYQEKLLEILRGKLTQADLDKINQIIDKIIADSL